MLAFVDDEMWANLMENEIKNLLQTTILDQQIISNRKNEHGGLYILRHALVRNGVNQIVRPTMKNTITPKMIEHMDPVYVWVEMVLD